jgi:hypothetical protein
MTTFTPILSVYILCRLHQENGNLNNQTWKWKYVCQPSTNEKGIMVFNATFLNISVTSWRLVLLLEETRISGENHPPAAKNELV